MSCSFRPNCIIVVLHDKLLGSTAQWLAVLSQIYLSSCMPGCETQFLTELLMKTEVLWSVMLYQMIGLHSSEGCSAFIFRMKQSKIIHSF